MKETRELKTGRKKNERGITLLALIITVVTMIILAAVTINVTLGEGGLVQQAQHAAEQTANVAKAESEQLDDVASQINDIIAGIGSGGDATNSTGGEDTNQVGETNTVDTNTVDTNTIEPEPEPLPDDTISIGEPQWQGGGTANVTVTSSESEYIIQYQINGTEDGNWLTVQNGIVTGAKHGDTVYARLTDGEQYSEIQNKKIEDKVPPEVIVTAQGSPTTNSITVTAQAVDNESGMKDNPTYTFQYKISGAGNYTTPDGAENISNMQYTFTGLTQGTSYDIQVIVNGDNAGNTGTGTLTNQTTSTVPGASEGLVTGSITASPATWDNYKASTILTTTTSFQIQYQVNETAEGSWSEAANSPVTVSNLNHGDTVYARLTDGANPGSHAAINILDGKAPTVSVEVGEVTDTTIAVTVTAEDNESGLADNNAYKYYLNNEEAPRETSSSNTYKYEGLTATTPYNIKVEVVDKGNNTGTGTTSATTKAPPIPDMGDAKPNPDQDGPKYTNTTEIQDDLGNPVVIPGGFHVDKDSGTKVEEGIVIEDDAGNQFVWIPTGEYNVSTSINASGKLTNNLSRRTFTTTGATEVSGDSVIESYYYGEGDSRSVAYNQIGAFKASAESTANGGKGGFYIGRYEQGIGNVCKAGVAPYTNITRDQAKNNIENMYAGNNNIESELISSYAWDTALNFICQTNVESGEGYNLAMTVSKDYGNIGTYTEENTGAYAADKYSNIHDFLGNCSEWTTEYSKNGGSPCVVRGGYYDDSDDHTAKRFSHSTKHTYFAYSARAQLYIK